MNEITATDRDEPVGHNNVERSNQYYDDNSPNPENVSKKIQDDGDIGINKNKNNNLIDEHDLPDAVSTRCDDTEISSIDKDIAPKTMYRCESNDNIKNHTESDNISTIKTMAAEKDMTEHDRVDADERDIIPDNLCTNIEQCSNEDAQDFTEKASDKKSCNQTKKVSDKKLLDPVVHRLYCKWCFWYDCQSRGNVKPVKQDSTSYQDSLNIINVITTVMSYAIHDFIISISFIVEIHILIALKQIYILYTCIVNENMMKL